MIQQAQADITPSFNLWSRASYCVCPQFDLHHSSRLLAPGVRIYVYPRASANLTVNSTISARLIKEPILADGAIQSDTSLVVPELIKITPRPRSLRASLNSPFNISADLTFVQRKRKVFGASNLQSKFTFTHNQYFLQIWNLRRMSTPYREGHDIRYEVTDEYAYNDQIKTYTQPKFIYRFRVPYRASFFGQITASQNAIVGRILKFYSYINTNINFTASLTYSPGLLASLLASLGSIDSSGVRKRNVNAILENIVSLIGTVSGPIRFQSYLNSLFLQSAQAKRLRSPGMSVTSTFSKQIRPVKTVRPKSFPSSAFTLPGNFNYRIRRTGSNPSTTFTPNFDTTLQLGLIQTISEATANSYMGNGSIKFSGNGNYIVQLLKLGTTYTLRHYELSADKQSILSTTDTTVTTDNIASTFKEVQTMSTGYLSIVSTTNKVYFVRQSDSIVRTYSVTNNVWSTIYTIFAFDTFNSSTNKRTIEIYDISNNLLNRIDSTVSFQPGQFSLGFNSTLAKFQLVAQQDGILKLFTSANNYAGGSLLGISGSSSLAFSEGVVDINTNATFIAAATPSLMGSNSINVFMWRFITNPSPQWQSAGIYNFQLDPDTSVNRIPKRIKISDNGKRLFVYYTRGQTHPAIAIYDIIQDPTNPASAVTVILQARIYNYSNATYTENGSYSSLDMSDDKRYFVEVNSDDSPGALRVYTLR